MKRHEQSKIEWRLAKLELECAEIRQENTLLDGENAKKDGENARLKALLAGEELPVEHRVWHEQTPVPHAYKAAPYHGDA